MRLICCQPFHCHILAQLHVAAFGETDAWTAETLGQTLLSPGAFGFLVLSHNDSAETSASGSVRPVGFVLGRVIAGEGEILTLAVDPTTRRAGYGSILINATASCVRAANAVNLFLEVADDNTAARRLYAAAGFMPVGRRSGYYMRPGALAVDALVLRLPLA